MFLIWDVIRQTPSPKKKRVYSPRTSLENNDALIISHIFLYPGGISIFIPTLKDYSVYINKKQLCIITLIDIFKVKNIQTQTPQR